MVNDDERTALDSIPDEFMVTDDGIDIDTQQEYVAYTKAFDHKTFSSEQIDERVGRLFSSDTYREEKKATLAILAHTGKVTSAKIINQFLEEGDPALHEWAKLCLLECHLFEDNVWFGDEGVGTVMTGLGGEDNRLRYFFAVRSNATNPYTSMDRTIITENFMVVCREHNAVLEDIQIQPTHATLKILIPLDVAVGMVIESGIGLSNRQGNLLDEDYYVTNVNIPTDVELQAFLNQDE